METGDVQMLPPSTARHRPPPSSSVRHFTADIPLSNKDAFVKDEANLYAQQLSTATQKLQVNGPTSERANSTSKSPSSTLQRVSPVPRLTSSSSASRSPDNNKEITVTKIQNDSPNSTEQGPLKRVSTLPGPLQISPPGSTMHAPYTRAHTTLAPAARLTSPHHRHHHAATLPAATTVTSTRSKKTPRVRREKKEKKIGHRRVDRNTGQVSYKRFPTNELMGALQEGIRHSISILASQQNTIRDVLYQDFAVVENVFHPSAGSPTTTPHPYADFRFKTYAPVAFRYFRNLFDIKTDDFLSAICDKPLIEITNPGASGSIFYITDDGLFILKTVQAKEAEFLQRLLAGYFLNLSQNPRTLLPKFFGIYCYQSLGKNVRVLAMNNIFPREVKMHEKYDLKGSTFGRKASKKERAKSCPTYKDLDFLEFHPNGIVLDPEIYEQVMKTIRRDCAVLESFKIMDYSLLIGIHNVDEAARQAMQENVDMNTQPGGGTVDAQQAALQAQQAAAALDKNETDELFSPVKTYKREPSSPNALIVSAGSSSRPREAKLTRHQSVHRQRLAAFPNERSSQDETALSAKPSSAMMRAGGRSIPEADDEVDAGDDDGNYETDETSESENEVDVEAAGENSDDDAEPVNVADYPDAIEGRNEQGDKLVLFMGIIDILQNYRLRKQLEHTFKAVLHDGKTVSVCHPTFYAQRFQDFMAERVLRARDEQPPASPTRSVASSQAVRADESAAVSEAHVEVGVVEKVHRRSLNEILGDVSYGMPGADESGLQPPHVADAEAAAHAAELAAHAAQEAAQVTQQPVHAEVALTDSSTQQIFLPAGQPLMPHQQQQDTGSSSGYYSSLRSNTASTSSNKTAAASVLTVTKAVGHAKAEPSPGARLGGKPQRYADDSSVRDVVGQAVTTTTVNDKNGLGRQISSSSSTTCDAVRKQKQDFFMPSKPPRAVEPKPVDNAALKSKVNVSAAVQTTATQPSSSNVPRNASKHAEENTDNGLRNANASVSSSSTFDSTEGSGSTSSEVAEKDLQADRGNLRGVAESSAATSTAHGASNAGYARFASSSPRSTSRHHVTTVTVNSPAMNDFDVAKKKKDQFSTFSVSSSAVGAAALENRLVNKKPVTVYPDASPLYVRKEFSIPSSTQTSTTTTRTTRGDNSNIVTVFSNNMNAVEQQLSGMKLPPRETFDSSKREQTASAAATAAALLAADEMGDMKKR